MVALIVLWFPLSTFVERGTGGAASPPDPLSANAERGNEARISRLTAHADGPPAAHTGGFGEPTCQECHQGSELNIAPGVLTLNGLPKVYRPNQTYTLSVVLSRAAMQAAGFQLSVRGEGLRRQAGVLASVDDRTRTIAPVAIEYLEHTRQGAGLTARDTAVWRFTWRAPQGVGPVVFHIAANAANGDDSPLDDFIYTQSVTLQVKP